MVCVCVNVHMCIMCVSIPFHCISILREAKEETALKKKKDTDVGRKYIWERWGKGLKRRIKVWLRVDSIKAILRRQKQFGTGTQILNM